MSTVWVPSEARDEPTSTWSIRITGGSTGDDADVVGRPGRLPPLVGELAGVPEPGVVELAHRLVVGGRVQVAHDQVGVRRSASSRITSWSARQARGSVGAVGCTASTVRSPPGPDRTGTGC